MRKTAWILTGLLVVSAAAAMAAEPPASDMSKDKGTTTTTTTMEKTEKKTAMKPGKTVSYAGETSNVKEADKTFTVTGKDGAKNFTWDEHTKVTGGKLADGQNATVKYSSGTQEPYLAKSIAIHKKKMDKMDKKPSR
ncbi:MAG TPA: hypothetical protein VGR07_24100 [Thermoanaerobaculia bacterium]|nr:hypothetical protein [Thermoanaerobaculia bacterium]